MGLVDKFVFESRGAHGCSNSDYTFAITTCCERVGVIDDELDDFYWSFETPSKSISLLNDSPCPFCDASDWNPRRLDRLDQVPEHWRWACDNQPRPGSRRVLPLAEHIRELVAFCRRVASPLPVWDEVLVLDTSDRRVRYDRGWIIASDVLITVAEFAPRFETLLLAGYSWVNLSAYGIFENDLVVGVELPRESVGVPAGLTPVNYSGPPRGTEGAPSWGLNLTITG
jgi:hypothetical protein